VSGGIESLRPRESLLNFGGRIDGDKRRKGFVHVENGTAFAGCGIETLVSALCFRLANVVENCGIVREPRELRDFGESFTRLTEYPLGGEAAGRCLSERGRKGDRDQEGQSEEQNSWAKVLQQLKSPFDILPSVKGGDSYWLIR
jgi:hypothetical protein